MWSERPFLWTTLWVAEIVEKTWEKLLRSVAAVT
jgi:hypothetical protein